MAFEGPGSPPLVVVAANLLYPFHLRNLLVQLGADAITAPCWTARIYAEWIGNLAAVGTQPGASGKPSNNAGAIGAS